MIYFLIWLNVRILHVYDDNKGSSGSSGNLHCTSTQHAKHIDLPEGTAVSRIGPRWLGIQKAHVEWWDAEVFDRTAMYRSKEIYCLPFFFQIWLNQRKRLLRSDPAHGDPSQLGSTELVSSDTRSVYVVWGHKLWLAGPFCRFQGFVLDPWPMTSLMNLGNSLKGFRKGLLSSCGMKHSSCLGWRCCLKNSVCQCFLRSWIQQGWKGKAMIQITVAVVLFDPLIHPWPQNCRWRKGLEDLIWSTPVI